LVRAADSAGPPRDRGGGGDRLRPRAAPGGRAAPGHCGGSALFVAQRALEGSGGRICGAPAAVPLPGAGQLLAARLNRHCVSVRLSACGPCALAGIACTAAQTGGRVRFGPAFGAAALHADLLGAPTAPCLWEASMRLRTPAASGSSRPRELRGARPGGVLSGGARTDRQRRRGPLD
jgi:hypothetical protein